MRFSIVVFCSMMALVACSSAKNDPVSNTVDGGGGSNMNNPPSPPDTNTMDAGSINNPPPPPVMDSGPHAPTNQAECIAACEMEYPKPAALNKQLDATCFLGGACVMSCNDLPPGGKLYGVTPPDPDGGVAACSIGEGIDPITTPAQACTDCIANTPACCNLWVAIFGTPDGRDLNKCAVKCYSTFTK